MQKYVMKLRSPLAVLLMSVLLFSGIYQFVQATGSWHGTDLDSPDWGSQYWYNHTNDVVWGTSFQWKNHPTPTQDRRIELEYYKPGSPTLYCDRLEPTTLTEYGGDWISSWWKDNQCGGANKERLVFNLKEQNVNSYTWYQVRTTALKLGGAGSGGETNVSWTCWFCSDDWLGKQYYNSSYNDNGSNP